jgi:hypothetical protein
VAVVASIVAGFALVALAMIGVDHAARWRRWRLGRWTLRFTRDRAWRIDTRWGQAVIHGGCERCGTSWRYVDPHCFAISPYGELAVLYPFCEKCHTSIPRMDRHRLYLQWWLDRRDDIAAEGAQPVPDVREWEEIKVQLRIDESPNRLVA